MVYETCQLWEKLVEWLAVSLDFCLCALMIDDLKLAVFDVEPELFCLLSHLQLK